MYKRRIAVFLAVIGLVLASLAAKLFRVQVLQADSLLSDAEQYLNKPRLLPAMRGRILDRQGRILALDEPCHDLCLDFRLMISPEAWFTPGGSTARSGSPESASSPPSGRAQAGADPLSRIAAKWIAGRQEAVAAQTGCSVEQAGQVLHQRWANTWRLAWKAADLTGQDLSAAVLDQVARICRMTRDGQRDYRALYLAHPVVTGLDREQAAAILAELPETVGLEVRPTHARKYPRGASACHVVGVTGPVTEEDLQDLNQPQYEPDWITWQRDSYLANDAIGKSGVELMCEGMLKGRRGYRTYRAGEPVGAIEPAVPGADVHLTVDVELQEALAKAFEDHAAAMNIPNATGAIVVLDVPSGEVLALVSEPTFDLNAYRKDYRQLAADNVRLPLRHRAVAQCYAPGSSAKPLAAIAALAEGKITPTTTFVCDNGIFPLSADGKPNCWIARYHTGHGPLDLIEGLRYSCNVYFAHVGGVVGPGGLCRWYRLFGYGSTPGTGLLDESPGLVPTDERMLRVEKRHLSPGDAWNMAIGQGPLAASPLQVAGAMAAVARGGRFVSPMLTLEAGPKRVRRSLGVNPDQIAAVREGMRQVVHHPEGTAHKFLVEAGLDALGVEFCGKTGTAQVPPQKIDSDGDGLLDKEVRWGDVVWFAGFAPPRDPKLAFAVMIEYVQGGAAEYAAPLALRVLEICKRTGHLPPEG